MNTAQVNTSHPMPLVSKSRWPFAVASVIAVLISLYAIFGAFLSARMGIGSIVEAGPLLPGMVLVLLAALAVWYVAALFASLWWRRAGLHIGAGLFFGFVILGWFVSLWGHQIFILVTHAGTWTGKTYFEVLCLGPVLVAALILTGLLLFVPSVVRRPTPGS